VEAVFVFTGAFFFGADFAWLLAAVVDFALPGCAFGAVYS
jgi:hypothetical protein